MSDSDQAAQAQFAADVRRLVQQNERILQALRATEGHIQHVPGDAQYHQEARRRELHVQKWKNDILPFKINDPNSRLRQLWSSFRWPRTHQDSALRRGPNNADDDDAPEEERTLEDMFSETQLWNSHQYRLSYPHLYKFLATVDLNVNTKTEVSYLDYDPDDHTNLAGKWISTEKYEPLRRGTINGAQTPQAEGLTRVLRQNVLDHHELWKQVKTRISDGNRRGSNLGLGRLSVAQKIPCRMLRITDLSGIVAGIVLGSTPRLDLAYVAPFLERYLKFSNWATTNMIMTGLDETGPTVGRKVKLVNTYLFEYHFAFYYVPTVLMDPDLADEDFRGLRHRAPFDRGLASRHRYIYEEQLSFILVGHGADVYTNYQLAEKYYVGPHLKGAEGISIFVSPMDWKPQTLFLTWISMALHHVAARWQTAIEAIDSQIDSPFEVIFHEAKDKADLLSDDPNFSRSKTYFWAIQVYKLFEETLTKTIKTWEDFKTDSLDRMNDGNIPHWETSVQVIDKAIDGLRDKLARVHKKREEVVNLRDGLFGASSLFDSRTAVRQGDYIRLLTYINLLFLPLTFVTSIFGMQTVLPNTMPILAFIITLPIVSSITAFLVFNLEDLVDFVQDRGQRVTAWMRHLMRHHRQKKWKKAADALAEDKHAGELPVKKRQKKSTHWVYFVFSLEALLVSIPVYELRCALNLWGVRSKTLLNDIAHTPVRVDSNLRARLVRAAEERKKKNEYRDKHQSKFARAVIRVIRIVTWVVSSIVRMVFLAVWIPLLTLDVVALYLYTLCLFAYTGNPQPPRDDATSIEDLRPPFDWIKPLHMLGLHDIRQYPALTPQERARKHWRNYSESISAPRGLSSGHHPHSTPSNQPVRRRTTFFKPVTRTFSGIFTRSPMTVKRAFSFRGGERGEATPNGSAHVGDPARPVNDIEQGSQELRSITRNMTVETLAPIREEDERRRSVAS